MEKQFKINTIAVLGAGVMGAQIASHFANSGFPVYLFDLPTAEDPNRISKAALKHLFDIKPAPLATPEVLSRIQPCNYQDDLKKLQSCDLILEAVAEQLPIKQALFSKIAPFIHEHAIIASNTSGLSIQELMSCLPAHLHAQFCGIHFFNPPRYMHLVELIPTGHTKPILLDFLESWLTRLIGKGVVRAKDTPNFIANRIGVFSLLMTLHHAKRFNIAPDEVDALTGQLLGRPKSATFRTMDVVGLDTLAHVVATMKEKLKEDPWHAYFTLPDWLQGLIDKKALGQKTNAGVYRKNGKEIEVFDPDLLQYRPSQAKVNDAIMAIFKIKDFPARMQALFTSDDPQALFLAACYRDLFHYSAYHLADIAHSAADVDLALQWGFGWADGPFKTWQMANLAEMRTNIEANMNAGKSSVNAPLPKWLFSLQSFYEEKSSYAPEKQQFVTHSPLSVYQRQIKLADFTSIVHHGVRVTSLPNDLYVLSFESKANSIGQSVLDGLFEVLDQYQHKARGFILYQPDPNTFCAGADLKSVLNHMNARQWSSVQTMIEQFQMLCMRLKYSSVPVVAALRGRALGGGCELLLHCARIVASFESYPGLVELGVGLIPGGGGCKEMALRAAQLSPVGDLMERIKPFYQRIAKAEVAGSATQALDWHYLQPADVIMMNGEEVLFGAIQTIEYLLTTNYQPEVAKTFKVAGKEGQAILELALTNWLEGGFISKYDYFIANKLAYILCGGPVAAGTLVNEEWLLQLERDVFRELTENPLTQARISHLLETGKPLRN